MLDKIVTNHLLFISSQLHQQTDIEIFKNTYVKVRGRAERENTVSRL